jgi:tetratricopeptide (TPR) repeat protein
VARKTRRLIPPAPTQGAGPSWLLAAVIALASAALGSGSTYLALKPARQQAAAALTLSAQAARQQGDQLEDHGQWAEAITAYQQAIASGLDNPDIRTDLGVAYFKSSQPQKALEQYTVAQQQNPAHENSLFNEASAYAVLGDSKRAISLWKEYLQRFPQGQHTADAKNFIATVQAHGIAGTTRAGK